MSNTVTVTIDKLGLWCGDRWKNYETNKLSLNRLTLRIQYDQLLILSDEVVLESLNLNGKMKSIFKDDVLILIIFTSPQQIRKIKFQIKTNLQQCLQILSLHIPVLNYKSSNSEYRSKYKKVDEVFKDALDGKVSLSTPSLLPPSFTNFVKLCLLDPNFPQVVDETQKILQDLNISK